MAVEALEIIDGPALARAIEAVPLSPADSRDTLTLVGGGSMKRQLAAAQEAGIDATLIAVTTDSGGKTHEVLADQQTPVIVRSRGEDFSGLADPTAFGEAGNLYQVSPGDMRNLIASGVIGDAYELDIVGGISYGDAKGAAIETSNSDTVRQLGDLRLEASPGETHQGKHLGRFITMACLQRFEPTEGRKAALNRAKQLMQQPDMMQIIPHRFEYAGSLERQHWANLVGAAAMAESNGDATEGFRLATRALQSDANIVPMATKATALEIRAQDGTLYSGEAEADNARMMQGWQSARLSPAVPLSQAGKAAIQRSWGVGLGPGSPATSTLPHALTDLGEAIRESEVPVVALTMNATEDVSTLGWPETNPVRYVDFVLQHGVPVNAVLAHNGDLPTAMREQIEEEQLRPVRLTQEHIDALGDAGIRLVLGDFMDYGLAGESRDAAGTRRSAGGHSGAALVRTHRALYLGVL